MNSKIQLSTTAILLHIILSVIISVQSFEVTQCWSCQSSLEPACGEKLNKSVLKLSNCLHDDRADLPGVKILCRKTFEKVNGQYLYNRSCSYFVEPILDKVSSFCTNVYRPNNRVFYECLCNDEDGCNGTNSMANRYDILVLSLSICLGLVYSALLR